MMKFKTFLHKYLFEIIGIVVGATGGYLYYNYIGCSTGSCPITSNPYISVAYGALMGYLFVGMFRKKRG